MAALVTASRTRGYSVIICTYNRREYVAESVRSVLGQTRPPEQVIVVDDGSSDGTAEFLKELFPDILVVSQQNMGRSIAANRGVSLAEHEWICLLDDDDLWHREKLAAVDRYLAAEPDCLALNHPVWFFRAAADAADMTGFGFSVDFAATTLDECHAAAEHESGSMNDITYLFIRGKSYQSLLERNRGGYSASVIRKDVFIAAGGMPPALKCADDWTLFLNVARITEWHTLERRLTFVRVHAGQSTGSPDNASAILAAYLAVWFGGRALPHPRGQLEIRALLAAYQTEYRMLVQRAMWGALLHGQWRNARDIRRLGRPLVIGWHNWLFVHVPPTFTHRLLRK